MRLGIGSVRGIGSELADEIEAVRKAGGLFTDTEDLVRRVPSLTLAQLEAMATGGLFGECFGLDRRDGAVDRRGPRRSRDPVVCRAWSPGTPRRVCRA